MHELSLYNDEYQANKADLTVRQNDLDVFQFIFDFTMCAAAASFAPTKLMVSETNHGKKALFFHDKKAREKYNKMARPMTMRKQNPSLMQRPRLNISQSRSRSSRPPVRASIPKSRIWRRKLQSTRMLWVGKIQCRAERSSAIPKSAVTVLSQHHSGANCS